MSDQTPEDKDGDGLTDGHRPSVAWLLWFTDALTHFCNGAMDGLSVGTMVGGANAAAGEEMDVKALTLRAVWGAVAVMFGSGLREFNAWRRTNPMPNPFRASPVVPK